LISLLFYDSCREPWLLLGTGLHNASSMDAKRKNFLALILIAVSASFLLAGYECVRSAGNTLFKTVYGVDRMAFANLFVPPTLIVSIYLYAKVLSKLGARMTFLACYIFSGIVMGLGYVTYVSGLEKFIFAVYVIRKIYVVILIEQYWSFLTSTMSTESGKKTFGVVLGISTIGAVLGGKLVGALAVPLGTDIMLLFSALFLIPAALISDFAFKIAGEPKPKVEEKKEKAVLALGLFKKSWLLPGILLIIISTQILSTALELNFQTILDTAFPNPDEQTAYSGNYFAILNGAALILQFFLSPVVLKWIPLSAVHIAIPIIHFGMAVGVLLNPNLAMVGLALLTFKAFDYSIFRAAKEIFYIPLSYDARYRAKQVIDVFGYRLGEGFASFAIVLFQGIGMFFVAFYASAAIFASIVWIGLLVPTLRAYQKTINR